jgi:hypothetical protein
VGVYAAVEPISLIVGALILGASDGLKETAKKAISDGYNALKRIISDRYKLSGAVQSIEKDPSSEARREVLADDLTGVGAGEDSELVNLAKALLEAVKQNDESGAKTLGIDLSKVYAGDITIKGIKASGGSTGVKMDQVTATKVHIEDVQATGQDPNNP